MSTKYGDITPRTIRPYHLSEDEIRQFDEKGYLLLRNRIHPDTLQRLQEASDRWIADGRAVADDPEPDPDFYYRDGRDGGGRRLFRVNFIHAKGNPASLELLGSPEMLGIAESLAGPNFVPTYESLVFKAEGDGVEIAWHQDAIHPRSGRIFNVGVYLDESRRGAGALRVAAGSQKTKVEICDLEGKYGWDAPGVVHEELNPGDVLIHDVMVVHGSEAVEGKTLRRTLYYEFRPAEQIEAEGPWDRTFIEQRMQLVPLALSEWKKQFPTRPAFQWNVENEYEPELIADEEVELRVVHNGELQSSFCSAGNSGVELEDSGMVSHTVA